MLEGFLFGLGVIGSLGVGAVVVLAAYVAFMWLIFR